MALRAARARARPTGAAAVRRRQHEGACAISNVGQRQGGQREQDNTWERGAASRHAAEGRCATLGVEKREGGLGKVQSMGARGARALRGAAGAGPWQHRGVARGVTRAVTQGVTGGLTPSTRCPRSS
jgi:hypothetical protein